MRALLIYPRFERFLQAHPELALLPPIAGMWKYRMPPALGLQILATMMPAGVEWSLIDANVSAIDADEPVDLVALSFFTPQAQSAYEIADAFRSRGVPVVMGGMHPSIFPADARPHCDALCLGEAEAIWPQVLADAAAGSLAPTYGPALAPPETWVTPRADLFALSQDYDWRAALVQAARGCPRPCPYCNIPVIQGAALRFRPVERVVEHVRSLADREIYLTEDVVMFKSQSVRQHTAELFARLAETPSRLFVSSALILDFRPELLELLARAGTRSLYVTFGFDPISRGIYEGDARLTEQACSLVRRVEDHGIRFYAAFGVGFDGDDCGVFDRVLDFCRRARVTTAEFFVATPFPGTPLWQTMSSQGRLHHTRWQEYNGAHVVFRPARMSEEQLQQGFLRLWTEHWRSVDVEEALRPFDRRTEPIAW